MSLETNSELANIESIAKGTVGKNVDANPQTTETIIVKNKGGKNKKRTNAKAKSKVTERRDLLKGDNKKPSNGSLSQEVEKEDTPEDIQKRFQKELKWCLDTLDSLLVCESSSSTSSGSSSTRIQEGQKVLKLLSNPKTSVIRKRQLMSNFFGDYRSKMAKEEGNLKTQANKSTISNCLKKPGTSGVFLKKRTNKSKVNDAPASQRFSFNFNTIAQDKDMDCPSTSSNWAANHNRDNMVINDYFAKWSNWTDTQSHVLFASVPILKPYLI